MIEYIEQILSSKIFSQWHWLNYHFRGLPYGKHTDFSFDFLNKIKLINHKIPGFAEETINRLASYSGKEKHEPHYEQIIQLLVEVVIIYRLSEGFLAKNVSFKWEPVTPISQKNPELLIEGEDWKTLIEIKCPSIFRHMREAGENDTQLGARIGEIEFFNSLSKSGKVTKPLDNKIKDFLVSAESKFAPFKATEQDISSILIIAWSKHLFEATSPLINGMSGLLTENSFYTGSNGKPITFPSVDSVLVTEHFELILRATREEPLPFGYNSPLDYGAFLMRDFLPPAHINNPSTPKSANPNVLAELGAVEIADIQEPRVNPLDYVMWLGKP